MKKWINDTSILIEEFQKSGIELNEKQIEQFMDYYELLIEKNKVMNLTAITDFKEVVQKHFVDSVSLFRAVDLKQYETLLDLGTGAGFPGMPLKIMYPDLEITLMDSLNKRIQFLNECIAELGLQKITAVHGRAEEAARKKEYREHFDLCVSRAVANLSSLSEYCLPFVKKNGAFISYKSKDVDMEIQNAKSALFLLGGSFEQKIEFDLPGTDIGRSFIIIKKVKNTPAKYPRKAGTPVKEPL